MNDTDAMKLALKWMSGLVTKYDSAKVSKIIDAFSKVFDQVRDWDEETKMEVGGLLLQIFEKAKSSSSQSAE